MFDPEAQVEVAARLGYETIRAYAEALDEPRYWEWSDQLSEVLEAYRTAARAVLHGEGFSWPWLLAPQPADPGPRAAGGEQKEKIFRRVIAGFAEATDA